MLLASKLAPFSQGDKLAEHGHAGGGCSVGDVAEGGSSMRTNGVEGGRSWENNGPKLEMRREMIKVRHFLNHFQMGAGKPLTSIKVCARLSSQ